MRHDPQQLVLDYSSAAVDRYRRLRNAVTATRGKLAEYYFLTWIQRVEKPNQGLSVSYETIADELLCSRRNAIRVVDRLESLGLIACRENRQVSGSQMPNEYRIDWVGVDRINAHTIAKRMGASVQTGLQDDVDEDEEASATGCQPGTSQCQVVTSQCQVGTHTKEYLFSSSSFQEKIPVPGAGSPTPNFGKVKFGKETPAVSSAGGTALAEIAEDGWKSVEVAPLVARMIEHVPTLREAGERALIPCAPTKLTGFGEAVFAGLQVVDLERPVMIQWHCEQLSLQRPFAGPTEAHLLLTLACGLFAARVDSQHVRRTRVAFWVHHVTYAKYRESLRYLDEVRERLDRYGANNPRGRWWLES